MGESQFVPAALLLIFLQPRAATAGGNLPSLLRNVFVKMKETEEGGEEPRCGWEAHSSCSRRAVQVSYRRCTAHPRGARFTVLVQSAKQTDQLGDISKRSWNKAGEEGINSLRGGMFQLTCCQPRRIPVHHKTSLCTTAHLSIPEHHNPPQSTTNHPSPVLETTCPRAPASCAATPAPQPRSMHPSLGSTPRPSHAGGCMCTHDLQAGASGFGSLPGWLQEGHKFSRVGLCGFYSPCGPTLAEQL